MDLTNKIEPGTEKELEEFGNRLYDFCKQIVPEFIGKTYGQCHEYLRYVIRRNGKNVAGILGKVKLNNTLYVEDLFVDEPFRNQGYAYALLTRIESEAKSIGCYLAYLETINKDAIQFYTNLGYEIFAQLNDEPCRGVTNFYLKKDL